MRSVGATVALSPRGWQHNCHRDARDMTLQSQWPGRRTLPTSMDGSFGQGSWQSRHTQRPASGLGSGLVGVRSVRGTWRAQSRKGPPIPAHRRLRRQQRRRIRRAVVCIGFDPVLQVGLPAAGVLLAAAHSKVHGGESPYGKALIVSKVNEFKVGNL
jgi:hypothetical protein